MYDILVNQFNKYVQLSDEEMEGVSPISSLPNWGITPKALAECELEKPAKSG